MVFLYIFRPERTLSPVRLMGPELQDCVVVCRPPHRRVGIPVRVGFCCVRGGLGEVSQDKE